MFSQLPMYQRVGNKALKKSLGNIITFCEFLGNPHTKFKSIHVAGTNGKGSSSSMLSAILQAAGHHVGLYTSPHLRNFTERIRLNGQEIPQQEVIDFVAKTMDFIKEVQPSFFEMTVAMAFDYFAREEVDYAVIEVGLGGRLDSTNIILPKLCLITNISMDHANTLGDTLSKIAAEKAGIIKEQTPVVISEWQDEVIPVFNEHAQQKNAPISFAAKELEWQDSAIYETQNNTYLFPHLRPYLKGRHQRANILGVITAAKKLDITLSHIQDGIENMSNYIQLKGRWQQLGTAPLIFCDVGHNEAGIDAVLTQLTNYSYNQLHIVWGMANDKDIRKILKMLPKNASYYFCKPNVPRGMDATELTTIALENGLKGKNYGTVKAARLAAQENASHNDFIYIGGSTFVVAELEDL